MARSLWQVTQYLLEEGVLVGAGGWRRELEPGHGPAAVGVRGCAWRGTLSRWTPARRPAGPACGLPDACSVGREPGSAAAIGAPSTAKVELVPRAHNLPIGVYGRYAKQDCQNLSLRWKQLKQAGINTLTSRKHRWDPRAAARHGPLLRHVRRLPAMARTPSRDRAASSGSASIEKGSGRRGLDYLGCGRCRVVFRLDRRHPQERSMRPPIRTGSPRGSRAASGVA